MAAERKTMVALATGSRIHYPRRTYVLNLGGCIRSILVRHLQGEPVPPYVLYAANVRIASSDAKGQVILAAENLSDPHGKTLHAIIRGAQNAYLSTEQNANSLNFSRIDGAHLEFSKDMDWEAIVVTWERYEVRDVATGVPIFSE